MRLPYGNREGRKVYPAESETTAGGVLPVIRPPAVAELKLVLGSAGASPSRPVPHSTPNLNRAAIAKLDVNVSLRSICQGAVLEAGRDLVGAPV